MFKVHVTISVATQSKLISNTAMSTADPSSWRGMSGDQYMNHIQDDLLAG